MGIEPTDRNRVAMPGVSTLGAPFTGTPCFFRQGIYTSSYHAPCGPPCQGDKAFGLSRNLLPPASEKHYRDRSQADFEIEQ
jgi:hypothetical protein